MEKAVKEALSLILEDWLEEGKGNTFDLVTEDMINTKRLFCTCLDDHSIQYQIQDNRLIVGNKKIYFYEQMKQYHI